jgi:phosphoribosylglycinamide formyltransferase 1
MKKFAVLASGNGTNFQALIDAVASGKIKNARICFLATDNPNAGAIARAQKAGIPHGVFLKTNYKSRNEMDDAVFAKISDAGVDYVFLLGYMRILSSPSVFAKYRNRIINLHPAILPSFTGIDAQKQAYDYGAKITGVTVHFVDEGLDSGPVIIQKALDISKLTDAHAVSDALRPLEHQSVVEAASMAANGAFSINGRHVEWAAGK